MKKFFTLFALLSLVLSASAETYNLSIWYKTSNLRTDMLPDLYFFDDNTHTKWPGDQDYANEFNMTWVRDETNTKVYKWEGSLNFLPTQFVFSFKGLDKSKDLYFINNGYYIDGHIDHVEGGDDGYTVYFYDDTPWYNVYIHTWMNNGPVYNPDDWPGYQMNYYQDTPIKYYHVLTSTSNKIIFNNNSGQQTPTVDAVDGMLYSKDGNFTLELSDDVNFSYPMDNFKVGKASYSRNCTNQWGSLCLPFEFSANQSGVTFYKMKSVTTGDNAAITFEPINGTIEAGQPVAFKLNGAGGLLSIENNDANGVDIVTGEKSSASIDGWIMHGTFKNISSSNVYIIQSNEIRYAASNFNLKAYRAWFTGNGNGAPLRISVDDTEGLQYVEQEDGTVKAYFDLPGRKLDGARKGLVIENGKIIMVK